MVSTGQMQSVETRKWQSHGRATLTFSRMVSMAATRCAFTRRVRLSCTRVGVRVRDPVRVWVED